MTHEIEDILNRVYELRKKLDNLVVKKGTADSEVLAASRMLNAVLDEYYKYMKKREDKKD